MPNLNRVLLIGNLTREPEIKHTPKGTAIASFGLAVNRAWKTEGGEKREEVTFIDCEAYARLAEIIGEYCKKGNPLFVEGRLKMDTWEDKQSGQKRSKMKVIAESIQLLAGKPQEGQQRAAQPPQQRGQAPAGRAQAGQPKQQSDAGYDPALDKGAEDYDF